MGASIKVDYRVLARITHSDGYTNPRTKDEAEAAFKNLQRWHKAALDKWKAGTYGDRSAMTEVTVKTRKQVYTLRQRLTPGDLCNVYAGTDEAGAELIFKVCRTPKNNDLVRNEAEKLKDLRSRFSSLKALVHIPVVVDTFELPGPKQCVVLQRLKGFYSLQQVADAHGALDLRDAAWMFNRLLAALLVAHQGGYVHGALTLGHFMICPSGEQEHNGVLLDWSYCVNVGQPLRAIVPQYRHFYPAEVFEKKPSTTGVDLFMASKCLKALVPDLPRNVAGLMNACQLGVRRRTSDVYELYREFNEALKMLYGPRKFRKFAMP
jgi:hypothetical protein